MSEADRRELMNRIDLKERIAISDAFTAEERDFLLHAINAMPETEDVYLIWSNEHRGWWGPLPAH